MTLGEILAGFKAFLLSIAGQGDSLDTPPVHAPVEGTEQAADAPASDTGIQINVRLLRSQQLGVDEIRQSYDPDDAQFPPGAGDGGGSIRRVSFGNRVLTFEVMVSQDDGTDSGLAFPIAENIRSRLQLASADLNSIGLGFSDSSDIENVTPMQDGRTYPEVRFTLIFNASVSYEDIAVTTIETVTAPQAELTL